MLLLEITPDTSIYQLTEALNCIKEDGETAHLIVAGEGVIGDITKVLDRHAELDNQINKAVDEAFDGTSVFFGDVKIGEVHQDEIHPQAEDADEYFEKLKEEVVQKIDNGELTPTDGVNKLWEIQKQAIEVRFAGLKGYIDGLVGNYDPTTN